MWLCNVVHACTCRWDGLVSPQLLAIVHSDCVDLYSTKGAYVKAVQLK